MKLNFLLRGLLLVVCVSCLPSELYAQKSGKNAKSKGDDYIRLGRVEGRKLPQSLETAIVSFKGTPKKIARKPVQVDLVAAVHLGDREYYEELNKRFAEYETVLFELVIPEGVEITDETFSKESLEERGNILSAFQEGVSTALGLEQQLNVVDYTAKNFVHADLTLEEFVNRISERGDLGSTFTRAFLHSLADSSREKSAKLEGRMIATLFSKNKTLSMKRLFAETMVDQIDDSLWILGGDAGSAILTDRNAIALEKLREQIQDGKTRIAIFYGAAHLPEFEKSLQKDFQLENRSTQWILAWDLTPNQNARKVE